MTDTNNNRVIIFDKDFNRVKDFGAKDDAGKTNGKAGTGVGEFNAPTGIDVEEKVNNEGQKYYRIYVSDSNNNRVQTFNYDGTSLTYWRLTSGETDYPFSFPAGIRIDDKIYVADLKNNRIVILSKEDNSFLNYLKAFGGYTDEGENGKFREPSDISADSTYLYVVDSQNDRIQIFDKKNYAFYKKIGFGSEDSLYGIAVDNDYIYVSDMLKDKVYRMKKDGSLADKKELAVSKAPVGLKLSGDYLYVVSSGENKILIYDKGVFDNTEKEPVKTKEPEIC